MSDTRALLDRISTLRQRLDQANGLLREAGLHALEGDTPIDREISAGLSAQELIDNSLRQLTSAFVDDQRIHPTQLTARARRSLDQARDVLAQLRRLADGPVLTSAGDNDPLARAFRAAASVVESAVRFLQAFPDSPGAQLRLCEGLDGILASAADRIAALSAAAGQRHLEDERTGLLARLLTGLIAGECSGVDAFTALADDVLADARQGAPLRFLAPRPISPASSQAEAINWQARFVAAHSLTVAQVLARIVRHAPEFRQRPHVPVVVALIHDAGMLEVPFEIISQPSPLTTEQHRIIELHTRVGAEAVASAAFDSMIVNAVTDHHERLDGTGYPQGRRELTPLTRFLAVADMYSALACDRPYRKALDPRTALTDTLLAAEQGLLDREGAECLLHLSFYPPGTVVELSDGSVAVVAATHPRTDDLYTPARPVVAVLSDPRGKLYTSPLHLDLAQIEGWSIVRALSADERKHLLADRFPIYA